MNGVESLKLSFYVWNTSLLTTGLETGCKPVLFSYILMSALGRHLCLLSQSPEAMNCQGVSVYHFVVKTFKGPFTSFYRSIYFLVNNSACIKEK